jgi:N-acetylmuramoyl-L-alanine amidase
MTTALHKMLAITESLIPTGHENRPGRRIPVDSITVHNTDNPKRGADANAHAKFLTNVGYYLLKGKKHWVSWHFTVDDSAIYQHLPLNEEGWHAGRGNSSSIGIEICMCQGIDQSAANVRAGILIAGLLNDLKLKVTSVFSHNHWTGKDCPVLLLERSHEGQKWRDFIAMIEGVQKNLIPGTPAIFDQQEIDEMTLPSDEVVPHDDLKIDLDHNLINIPDDLLS